MKKIYLSFLISFITTILSAQFFQELESSFTGVGYSSIAFADVDGDDDQDVLITGSITDNSETTAELYLNDGDGVFTLATGTPFTGVWTGSIAFADIDNDNDQDVLITGQDSAASTASSKLYTNDGNGIFTEVTGTPFDGVGSSSIAFADIDDDNDQDLLITGQINGSSLQRITKLYTNDGNGIFTVVTGTLFDNVSWSSVAFADVDNDNDQDVLITGFTNNAVPFQKISKLYSNDGNGIYTEVIGTPFDGVGSSSIAFADIDNDGDQDVLITGVNNADVRVAKLYTNDGTGIFTLVADTPFQGVNASSIAFADIDNDNDQDVLITGTNIGNTVSNLYINDGNGNFIEDTETPFLPVFFSSVAFSDVDNDNDQDLLITGVPGHNAILYENISCIPNSGIDTQTSCNSYTWIDGNTYTSSNNIATHSLINSAGCDSLVTLNLTINYSTNSTDVISACNSYTWIDGITYISSNNAATYNIIGGSSNGCDSLVNLDLIILENANSIDVISACDSYTWINGINYTGSNNTDTFTIVGGAINGCDSIITLNLTIIHSTEGTDLQTACDSFTWINGVTYSGNNNTATHTLFGAAANGCDSIVTLDLTIFNSTTGVDVQTSCGPFTWINGSTYTSSTNTVNYTIEGGASNGCDSIVTLDLTIINGSSGIDVQSACNAFTWINGNTYTESNNTDTYTIIGGAANGCDSVITLNLTVNPIDISIFQNGGTLIANASGANYQWLSCDGFYEIGGETNQSFTPLINGYYAVEIEQNSCIDTSACYAVVGIGISENDIFSNVNIYPNPSNGQVNIELGDLSDVTISIYTLNGNLIYFKDEINSPKYQFKFDAHPGIYLIEVSTNEIKQQYKLVKN